MSGIGHQAVVVSVHRYGDDDHEEGEACEEQDAASGPVLTRSRDAEFLTPTSEGDLQHVSAEVGQEHLHHAQVHVQRLKPRPREGRQQEVVQEEGGADAEPPGRILRQPAVQQEDQVEEEEGHAELDQDLRRDVPEKLPETRRSCQAATGRRRRRETGLTRTKGTSVAWRPGRRPRSRSRCR